MNNDFKSSVQQQALDELVSFLSMDRGDATLTTLSLVNPRCRAAVLKRRPIELFGWILGFEGRCKLTISQGSGRSRELVGEEAASPVCCLWCDELEEVSLVLDRLEFLELKMLASLIDEIVVKFSSCAVSVLITSDSTLEEVCEDILKIVFCKLSGILVQFSMDYFPPHMPTLGGARLTKITLRHYRGHSAWLEETLKHLPVLLSLSISDVALLNVGYLPCSLEVLVMESVGEVSSVFMDCVRGCHRLRKLIMHGCSWLSELQCIGQMKQLEVLSLKNTAIDADGLDGIENCTLLRHVNLSSCASMKGLDSLCQLHHIKYLFLYCTPITNASILVISQCMFVEKLNLGGCIHVSDVNGLGCLLCLKELHLWSTGVTNNGIRGLGTCSALEELVLDECVKLTDVNVLGQLANLKYLSLISTDVDRNGIQLLINCASLECLGVSGTRVVNAPKLWNHKSIEKFLLSCAS